MSHKNISKIKFDYGDKGPNYEINMQIDVGRFAKQYNAVGWQDNYFCDIFGAYLNFHSNLLGKTRDDKLIVWADWDGFNPINYMEEKPISTNGKYSTYVIAEKLFWRIMTED